MKYLLFREVIENNVVNIYTHRYNWIRKRDLCVKLHSKIIDLVNLLILLFTITAYVVMLGIVTSSYWCYVISEILTVIFIISGIKTIIIYSKFRRIRKWKENFRETQEYIDQVTL